MLNVCDHPVIAHNLSIMRQEDTPSAEFRRRLRLIASLLVFEATRDVPQQDAEITTPLEKTNAKLLSVADPLFVSILRAGNGILDGALEVFPEAKVGFLGMYRDEETLEPKSYYENLPADLSNCQIILLDPMLATGGSACDAISVLQKRGAKQMRFVTLVCAPEGVKAVENIAPDVQIYTASLDRKLNERGYILPGLGDAGDRIYNSK